MQFDNDIDNLGTEVNTDTAEESRDKTLEWLLEQDMAEPADTLFTLAQEQHDASSLTEFEKEVAARPMFGGSATADDLSSVVQEEIVLSADASSSIYTADDDGSDNDSGLHSGGVMAIHHGAERVAASAPGEPVEDGLDILGLADEDSIGEQFLTLKTVRPKVEAEKAAEITPEPVAEPAPEVVAQADEEVREEQPQTLAMEAAALDDELPALDEIVAAAESEEEPLDDAPLGDLVSADALEFLSAGDDIDLSDMALNEETGDAGERADSVKDYVDATAPPADDAAFDEYLVRGENLPADDLSPDDIAVSATPGVDSVDPEVSADIDYHEDFRAMEGFADNAVADVTTVIGPVMDELSAAVASRLSALGLEPEAVTVELMLGNDRGSIIQCVAEGYVPVKDVAPELPAAMQPLSREQLGTVYLRFTHEESGELWNRLLQPDFKLPGQPDDAIAYTGTIDLSAPVGGAEVSPDVVDEEAAAETQVEPPALELATADDPVPPAEDLVLNLDELSLVPVEDAVEDASTEDDEAVDLAAAALSLDDDDDIDLSIDMVLDDSAAITEDDLPSFDLGDFTLGDEENSDAELEDEFTALLSSDAELNDIEVQAEEPVVEQAPELTPHDEDITSLQVDSPEAEVSAANDEAAAFNLDDYLVPPMGAELPEDAAQPDETEAVAAPEPVVDTSSVFDDDIFASDLSDELFDSESDVDVEALIEGLSHNEADIDDLIGDQLEVIAAEQRDPEPQAQEPVPEAAPSIDAEPTAWAIPSDIEFATAGDNSGEIFHDFLDAFIDEAASELEKLEDAVAAWEQMPDSDSAFAPVPRILHTLKGIATGVGLARYGTLIHNFETLLEKLPRIQGEDQAPYFHVVNIWLDAASRGFEHIRDQREDIDSELPEAAAVAAATSTPEPVAAAAPAVQTQAREDSGDKQLADEGAKTLAAQQTIRMTADAVDHLMNLTNQAQQLGVRSSQSNLRGKRTAAELVGRLTSVRSHIAKIADRALLNVTSSGAGQSSELDALEMDQYSELQEAANILREAVEDLDDLVNLSNRHMNQAEALMKQQAASLSALRSAIQAARVVPVSRLMPGLRRIVRTVGADLGKAVSFRVINEQGALDRDNHARCQIILEHMVRNALDHGIETPEERSVAGKSVNGRISIDVGKDGSDYVITLSDDGRGIDPDLMRMAAYDKGLDIDVDALSDDEAVRLIFHKGFSTAASVSEISGRGVGMDIVLSELQEIGGDIDIQSVVGQGTSFIIRVPSNVSLNGALLVSAAEKSYAIPLTGLIAIEHVDVHAFYNALANKSKLSIVGMDCEPAYLATLCDGASLPDRGAWGATVPVIIAGNDERHMAIAIDDVQQALELVVRSLGSQFSMVPGLAGAATTADGQAIVALDLNALVESAVTEELSPAANDEPARDGLLVLVVDDSRTQRMVATSQFDSLGVETVTAENGLVAIDLLNTTHRLPDVVLLDVEMPVQDGIQTLREIRKSQRYSDLPVIMVTSRTGAKHRALAKEAGCNGYMGKPFNFPALVEEISQLTGYELKLS